MRKSGEIRWEKEERSRKARAEKEVEGEKRSGQRLGGKELERAPLILLYQNIILHKHILYKYVLLLNTVYLTNNC